MLFYPEEGTLSLCQKMTRGEPSDIRQKSDRWFGVSYISSDVIIHTVVHRALHAESNDGGDFRKERGELGSDHAMPTAAVYDVSKLS